MYSDTLILPNGDKVNVSDIHFDEPKHEYDIGTRMDFGLKQKEDEDDRFLEDYMKKNFVRIMEIGPSSYRNPNEE